MEGLGRGKKTRVSSQHFPRGEADRGRHDAQAHAARRILLMHISAVTSTACMQEGGWVGGGGGENLLNHQFHCGGLHKQQLLHVNEKLPPDAFAAVPGCPPDSDMCATSQIMSPTRGNDRSKEKEE